MQTYFFFRLNEYSFTHFPLWLFFFLKILGIPLTDIQMASEEDQKYQPTVKERKMEKSLLSNFEKLFSFYFKGRKTES